MTLERAIELLKFEYNRAKQQEHIKNPLAYALYQVWKVANKKEVKKMTEREELIKACAEITSLCKSQVACSFCSYPASKPFCTSMAIADTLLRKGIIMLPCKVGDSLFTVAKVGVIMEHEVIQIRISDNGIVFDCISKTLHGKDFCFSNDLIGKTVFLTLEEAKKLLQK